MNAYIEVNSNIEYSEPLKLYKYYWDMTRRYVLFVYVQLPAHLNPLSVYPFPKPA